MDRDRKVTYIMDGRVDAIYCSCGGKGIKVDTTQDEKKR